MSIKENTEELQDKFSFDMQDFLDLYKRKLPREDIAKRLELSEYAIRKIGNTLHLKWPKGKRAASYIKYMVELNADTTNEEEALEQSHKDNEYLTHKLKIANRALQRSRDEANQLRTHMRSINREDSLEQSIIDIVDKAVPMKNQTQVVVNIKEPSNQYEHHVSALLLSDLHVEESVSIKDVGLVNEYTWDIMETRLDRLFSEWLSSYRGESRACVFLLGDVISGIIHDVLETTTKPTGEAIHELADILTDYFIGASEIFELVDIFVVSGNHERLTERIKSTSKGFDFGYLFAQILRAKLSSIRNINIEISTTGFIATRIGAKVVGGHHGDLFRGPTNSDARTFKIYEGFKNTLGYEVDHLLQGHTHQFQYFNTHKGSCVVNGSLIGSNAYGHTNGFVALRPSQTMISFLPDGEIEHVRQVFVD